MQNPHLYAAQGNFVNFISSWLPPLTFYCGEILCFLILFYSIFFFFAVGGNKTGRVEDMGFGLAVVPEPEEREKCIFLFCKPFYFSLVLCSKAEMGIWI